MENLSHPGSVGEIGRTNKVSNPLWRAYAKQMGKDAQSFDISHLRQDEYHEWLSGVLQNKTKLEDAPSDLEFCLDTYGIDYDSMDYQNRALLNDILRFCIEVTVDYAWAMRSAWDEYNQKIVDDSPDDLPEYDGDGYQKRKYKWINPYFNNEIIESMKYNRDDTLQLTLYSKDMADRFVSKLDTEAQCPDEHNGAPQRPAFFRRPRSFVLNIDLPDIISEKWNYGGSDRNAKPVPEGEIEYGEFYKECASTIWRTIEHSEQQDDLRFFRLNPVAQHSPLKYYYLFEIVRGKDRNDWPDYYIPHDEDYSATWE